PSRYGRKNSSQTALFGPIVNRRQSRRPLLPQSLHLSSQLRLHTCAPPSASVCSPLLCPFTAFRKRTPIARPGRKKTKLLLAKRPSRMALLWLPTILFRVAPLSK